MIEFPSVWQCLVLGAPGLVLKWNHISWFPVHLLCLMSCLLPPWAPYSGSLFAKSESNRERDSQRARGVRLTQKRASSAPQTHLFWMLLHARSQELLVPPLSWFLGLCFPPGASHCSPHLAVADPEAGMIIPHYSISASSKEVLLIDQDAAVGGIRTWETKPGGPDPSPRSAIRSHPIAETSCSTSL